MPGQITASQGTNLHKYSNKNKIHQFLLRRFLDAVHREIIRLAPSVILDFGCGEGLFWSAMWKRGMSRDCRVTGIDLRDAGLTIAKELCPQYTFAHINLLDLDPEKDRYDLITAIEVMEHLADPDTYLQHLCKLSRKNLILTVPHEPWFRLLNFLRGRNIAQWGNHPEHVNHWSLESFGDWAGTSIAIDRLYGVFPWVILVGSKKTL